VGPDYDALSKEAEALRAYKGFGGIGLLEHDPEKGALLLERALPGISLKSAYPNQGTEALHVVCRIMTKLHRAPINELGSFYALQDWLSSVDTEGSLPQSYLEKARALKKQLFDTPEKPVLLHGDLQYDNMLLDGENWVAIDPKGIVGESYSDIWPIIRNPLSDIPLVANILKADPNRIRNWCFVNGVSVAKWHLENNLDAEVLLEYIRKLDCL